MNPITHYERIAKSLWISQLPPNTKGLRLYSLADAIDKYVRRARASYDGSTAKRDLWQRSANDRALGYLVELACDCRTMGVACQKSNAEPVAAPRRLR